MAALVIVLTPETVKLFNRNCQKLVPLVQVAVIGERRVLRQQRGAGDELFRRLERVHHHQDDRQVDDDGDHDKERRTASSGSADAALVVEHVSAPLPAKQEDDEHHQDHQRDEGHGRAEADIVAAEGVAIGEQHEVLGRIGRPALGQQPRRVEIVHRPDRHQEAEHDRDVAQLRHRHVAELVPARGAVERRRLVEAAIDALQRGQQRQHHERERAPDLDGDDHRDRPVLVGKEIDRAAAEGGDHLVEQRMLVGHHPAPRDDRDDRGHDPGQEQRDAEEAAERHVLVHEQRQPEAEHIAADRR